MIIHKCIIPLEIHIWCNHQGIRQCLFFHQWTNHQDFIIIIMIILIQITPQTFQQISNNIHQLNFLIAWIIFQIASCLKVLLTNHKLLKLISKVKIIKLKKFVREFHINAKNISQINARRSTRIWKNIQIQILNLHLNPRQKRK